MTTGAIYGNFKNRSELFIALGQTYWTPITPKVSPDATFAQAMHALAKATLAAVDDRASVAIGRLTGVAYALKNAELRSLILSACRGRTLPRVETAHSKDSRRLALIDPCPVVAPG